MVSGLMTPLQLAGLEVLQALEQTWAKTFAVNEHLLKKRTYLCVQAKSLGTYA